MWPFKSKKWETIGKYYLAVEIQDILDLSKAEHTFLKDRCYQALPLSDFKDIIWACRPQPHDELKYVAEKFDCDDFAVCFLADIKRYWARKSKGNTPLAFGYIQATINGGRNHAFIWQLDNTGAINYFEPQDNRQINPKFESIFLIES